MMRHLLAALLLLPALALAETVTSKTELAWDYDQADESRIDGFRLYCDKARMKDIPGATVRIADLSGVPVGAHVCHMTAFNAVGESAPSNELGLTVVDAAPGAPSGLRIRLTLEVQ